MAFVAVNVGFNDSVERARTFARKTAMTYPAIFDGSDEYPALPAARRADHHHRRQQRRDPVRNFATPEITEEHAPAG